MGEAEIIDPEDMGEVETIDPEDMGEAEIIDSEGQFHSWGHLFDSYFHKAIQWSIKDFLCTLHDLRYIILYIFMTFI